jgi:hypothetical protein
MTIQSQAEIGHIYGYAAHIQFHLSILMFCSRDVCHLSHPLMDFKSDKGAMQRKSNQKEVVAKLSWRLL